MLLNENQLQTLQAVCDRVIPPDEWPGAWDAGVGAYILRLLQTDAAPVLPVYQIGLDSLNAEAQARFNLGFAQIGVDAQDELLHGIERGEAQAFLAHFIAAGIQYDY